MPRKCQVVPTGLSSLQILYRQTSCEACAGRPVVSIHLGYGTCLAVSIFGMWGTVSFSVVGVCIRLHDDKFVLELSLCIHILNIYSFILSCMLLNDCIIYLSCLPIYKFCSGITHTYDLVNVSS